MHDPVSFLHDLLKTAIAAADPRVTLAAHVPPLPKGRVVVIGAGKAAASMAVAVEASFPLDKISGVVVTRYGYGLPTQKIKVIEAAHPVPDEAGGVAAREIVQAVSGLNENDLVLALISGGGSALLPLPLPGITLEEKRAINKQLLKSGASIHEMNCVRKHLSAIKGGRLALAAAPARVHTLLISDIPGDVAHTIASGPTLPDPTTQAEALAVIAKYGIAISDAALTVLLDKNNETPKAIPRATHTIVGRASDSLKAAALLAEQRGVRAIVLGDDVEGFSRDVAREHMARALAETQRPCVILSGGETTVAVKGSGRGGRNSEYALACFLEVQGASGVYVLAADTDGVDGSEENAGAFFSPESWARAQELGLDATAYLANNDAYSFFEFLGGLVVTGPTCTNVNDFRAILLV